MHMFHANFKVKQQGDYYKSKAYRRNVLTSTEVVARSCKRSLKSQMYICHDMSLLCTFLYEKHSSTS